MDERTQMRMAKKANGHFTTADLSTYVRSLVSEDAPVYVLKLGEWVRVGNHWVFMKSSGSDMDDAWVNLIVLNDTVNRVQREIAQRRQPTVQVVWDEQIPNTNIYVDFWYVGDGSGGVALAVCTQP